WAEDDQQGTFVDDPSSFVLRPSSDNSEVTTVELVAELMGKLSNIILVGEDGAVMDSIKRVPSSINRYRVVLPNHRYTPPPPQDKRDPLAATINVLSLELSKVAEQDKSVHAWKG